MEFWFEEEHKILRDSIHKFVANEITPHVEEWDELGLTPRSLVQQMGELGYLGLMYPEEYGGQGGDVFSAIILAEELGRSGSLGVANTVLVHAYMAVPIILRYGTEEQKHDYFEPAIKGQKIASLGITEPGAGSDVSLLKTVAHKDGDRWIINGTKIFITNGTQADFVVLAARTEPGQGSRGISVILVNRDAPGFSVSRKLQKVGNHASDTAELVFEDCAVPLDRLVGEEGKGFNQIMWELQLERLVVGAAATAAGEYALEMAIAYCQQRQQFGRPLAGFQALQHRIVDLATALEAGKQLVYGAAWKYKHDLYPVKEVSMAKLYCTNTAFMAADYALQLHGGYGYMMEYPIQRLWRDLRLWRIGGGTDEIMREIIAGQMQLVPKEQRR
ncbi:MAG: acyl-CoA dehydrogenase [Clostridia bacterium]|nr:MAG: acyl-CoA dehydrogenase [Clostridia bacterium]